MRRNLGTLTYCCIRLPCISYWLLLQHVRANKASLQTLSVSSLVLPPHQLLRVDQQHRYRPWRRGFRTLPRHHQCKSNFVRKSRNSEGGLINFQKNWAKIVGPRDTSRVSRSTSSSKPSNSSVKPGEKTFLRRKRFSKNSYGSKNVKQEQTRNKVQTKVQNVRTRAAEERQTWRNKKQSTSLQLTENTCGSSKTIETD